MSTCTREQQYIAIDAYIEQQMRRLNIPGAALAIVAGDAIAHQRGFGHARPAGETPSPLTPFFIGSLTKSFTALAVMQLAEAGKLEPDAPVQRYLPWFRVADAQASAQITVRQLLNQTSGLPALPGMTALADFDHSPSASERQARALATLKLGHAVGSQFEYSNLNYNLLGLVIEATSGESYADYIQKHIFVPLEMFHSYLCPEKAKRNGLALGHRYWFAFPFPARNLKIPRGSLASGQLISCAQDMAHYLTAYLNGGRYGSAQILSANGIAELQRGVAEFNTMGMSVGKYGMGWISTANDKTKILWHGGNVPDFSCFMALLPEQKRGVILLINADHYGLPPILAEVGLGVTALLAEQKPASTRLGFIPWAMRALLLVPLLQIISLVATARATRRKRASLFQPLLSVGLNVSVAALAIYLHFKGLLRYFKLFNPDIYWLTVFCGGLAGLFGALGLSRFVRACAKR